jgi:hypothetical protein
MHTRSTALFDAGKNMMQDQSFISQLEQRVGVNKYH